MNHVWEQITGYEYDEIDTIDKWVKKAYGKTVTNNDRFEKIFNDDIVDRGEYHVKSKYGHQVILKFKSSDLGKIDNQRSIIACGVDITELKEKDKFIIAQSRHAAMGEMISMIAHQWRQPITTISMAANNLLLSIDLEELNALEV